MKQKIVEKKFYEKNFVLEKNTFFFAKITFFCKN